MLRYYCHTILYELSPWGALNFSLVWLFSAEHQNGEGGLRKNWFFFKGALDKYNIIPNFFPKKLGFLYH